MTCTEINPVGNYEPWETSKLHELERNEITDCLGQKLLFENDNIRVWEVVLFPKERLPFRKINRNYSFVSMIDGLAITRNANGKISLLRLKKGVSEFMPMEGAQAVYDLENIGENLLFIHLMEFKPIIETINSLHISSFL